MSKDDMTYLDNKDSPLENGFYALSISSFLKEITEKAISDLYGEELLQEFGVVITVPSDIKWGDYTSNISMLLANRLKQPPLEIAKNIQYRVSQIMAERKSESLSIDISIAPPGYLNFKIPMSRLKDLLNFWNRTEIAYGVSGFQPKKDTSIDEKGPLAGKKIMVEYTDPNPFKVFHIGHLMPNTVGECLARLFEFCGAEVKRASYQGDVGMHVAKSIWGMMQSMEKEELSLEDLEALPLSERMSFLGKCYALGAQNYKDDTMVHIQQINALVYVVAQEMLQEEYDWNPELNYKEKLGIPATSEDLSQIKKLYMAGRSWSLEYFETVYKTLGTKFDFYYFESMAGEYGYKMVMEYLEPSSSKKIFEKENGAVIFKGEDYGLHTRVFINSKGLPTYEAKDLGLPFLKQKDYDYDTSYIITASEQSAYFQVVFKVLDQINASLAEKTHHVAHGMLNLTTGKMSSRTGDVISVDELLEQLSSVAYEKMSETSSIETEEEKSEISQKIAVASLKYSILRQQLGKDITYDREKSLQMVGDTGPYLQYSYVRAFSILEKANFIWGDFSMLNDEESAPDLVEEMLLLRQLSHFSDVVLKSLEELAPSHICTYLHELASQFNTFYAKSPILTESDQNKKNFRISLTNAFACTLKNGLEILGITAVEKM